MSRRRLSDRTLSAWVYVAESGIHGRGVFAARDIPRGTYIGTFHGPAAQRDGTHVLWVYGSSDGAPPVGRRGRNLLRFLNHGVRCNAEFDGFDLYACRRIACDEEITIDYGGTP
ncbi:MAG: SET domain-containing protein [Gammaproteobacteria bacterium]|nr:SET domain-containing protein [Gammaproteobacteria bacterium]